MEKIIAITENAALIAEANELLLRTEQSDDIDDNEEINELIERILKYIQDEEYPLEHEEKIEFEKTHGIIQSIHLIHHRPQTDEVVKKLFNRKREIRKRYKVKVSKIYVDSKKLKYIMRRIKT